MRLYNTLSRKAEDFKPLKESGVSLYTCGPTVYDYAHLGNLRSFVFDDTLRRILEVNHYSVKHIMNITDVGHLASDADSGEDKLEKGAARESKTVWEVADFYIDAFKKDMEALNILPPNGYRGEDGPYARATRFIDQQIELIKLLIDKGFAYPTEQAIYFDVTKLADYGQLSGQKLSDKEVAAREEVVVDKDKKNPQDFAVWFFTVGRFANHSMHWPSPWGEGFPGWHLECSAIIHSTLGDPIDIHTGGVDHIGTHHVNEMAQTEAAFGNKLANYWLHNEFLLVEGKKMSKSQDNFYTLKDVIEKGYDPLALRLLFLQSHYRTQSNFTWENLDAAQNRLKEYNTLADLKWQLVSVGDDIFSHALDSHKNAITDAMLNDLNTPLALATLSGLSDAVLKAGISTENKEKFYDLLKWLDSIFGLGLTSREDISAEQKSLINEREEARKNQDWAKSDELRTKLSEQGIELNDTDRGPVWSRK